MSDIRAELGAMLKEFPTIRVEEHDDLLVAICPGANTYRVALVEEADEVTIFLAGYRQRFSKEQGRDALGLFLTGLSDTCRLQVFSRGGTDYKWVVEMINFQGYWSALAMLVNPFVALAFWRKKRLRCLQNTVVTRADIERLFPEARCPGPEEQPASV